jgi:hypothetical protein
MLVIYAGRENAGAPAAFWPPKLQNFDLPAATK